MYGPYSSQEISSWKAQGFLTGPTSVLIRKVSSSTTSQEGEWVSSDSIDFSSYITLENEEKGKDSINVRNQGKRKRAVVQGDDDDDDVDDGDNEDDPDDDGTLGGGKRRRKGLRWDKDHDDEDD